MTARFGLSETTIEKICGVFAKFPAVTRAMVYGSRAKGNYKNGSDIDLILHGADIDLETLNKIQIELDDLLLSYTIDVAVYEQLTDPDFIAHIQRVGVVFYEHAPQIAR